MADRLGLHVKTVRHYVRDGRLKAVRIGKQYRIARADLEALTGVRRRRSIRSVRAHRHVEVSSIVEIEAVGSETANRRHHDADGHRQRGGGSGEEPCASRRSTIPSGAASKSSSWAELLASVDALNLVNVWIESRQMARIYKSEAGARAVEDRYREVLALWPVPNRQLRVPTREGETFIVVSGRDRSAAVVVSRLGRQFRLLDGRRRALAEHFYVCAIDMIGEPGLSAPSRPKLE